MRRKRHKKKNTAKIVLFIVCIITLSYIGVSYAYWDSTLMIINQITTGFLGVRFEEAITSDDLTITFNEDKSEMLIEGTVEENMTEVVTETDEAMIISAEYSDYEGYFRYDIEDYGSVDAKLSDMRIYKDDTLFLEDSAYGSEESRQLHIKAGEGVYNFEIQLHFTN